MKSCFFVPPIVYGSKHKSVTEPVNMKECGFKTRPADLSSWLYKIMTVRLQVSGYTIPCVHNTKQKWRLSNVFYLKMIDISSSVYHIMRLVESFSIACHIKLKKGHIYDSGETVRQKGTSQTSNSDWRFIMVTLLKWQKETEDTLESKQWLLSYKSVILFQVL